MDRRFIHSKFCVLMLFLLVSCNTDERLPEGESGNITLEFSTGLSVSRATEDTEIESALSHFDIFIWKLDGSNNEPNTKVHYERINGPLQSPTGTVTLSVQKGEFEANVLYRIDVIANATATEETFNGYTQWSQLRDAVQTDYRIQVTGGHQLGAVGTTIQDVPGYFLMDGIATLDGTGTSAVLNDGGSNNTSLKVTLSRAAAKVEVRLKHGNTIRFDNSLEAKQNMGYYLRNMPYSTPLLAGVANNNPILRKTDLFADATNVFFHWTETQVTITAYVYSHHWERTDFFEKGTRMAVSLPVWYKAGATETEIVDSESWTEYPTNFYQVLLTRESKFERNTHYIVEATIDMPGATDNSEPVTLTNLRYSAKDWTPFGVNIGADAKPAYLSVNKDTLDMHNIAEDATSLSFVSSSAVSVKINEVYYYDIFGQKQTVSNHGVVVTPDAGLNGNITVNSPIPVNNTIRYIKLTVNNDDGSAEEEVLVRQYPLEYITNIQGYYSYRSDFGGTTYETAGTNGYVGATWGTSDWNYSRNDGTSDGADFGSKVAKPNNDGTSDLYYYYWWKRSQNQGGGRPNFGGSNNYTQSSTVIERAGNLTALDNARMYHVRITSTSNEYKVGIPKQTVVDGGHFTDNTSVNNELVSPSFMIASQLGASQALSSVDVAASHCANYVETYKDDNGNVVHLTNWRLPTQKEIQIITRFQYVDNAAMDEVLSGDNYWSARGIINKSTGEINTNDDVTSANIRCIRDAY